MPAFKYRMEVALGGDHYFSLLLMKWSNTIAMEIPSTYSPSLVK